MPRTLYCLEPYAYTRRTEGTTTNYNNPFASPIFSLVSLSSLRTKHVQICSIATFATFAFVFFSLTPLFQLFLIHLDLYPFVVYRPQVTFLYLHSTWNPFQSIIFSSPFYYRTAIRQFTQLLFSNRANTGSPNHP